MSRGCALPGSALAVVDEQHRFGVRQRLGLREKGEDPDLLVMTATPIPRSLALTLYGDLDLSTIDELPPGRRSVSTRVVGEPGRRAAWELLRAEVSQGRRAYVVCPLIEEGGEEDPATAVRMAERLQAHFPRFRVGLVHGRMPIEERSRAMERFRTGETPLLVATTVVEVGLDVPEATVILIERAERFGLSQLHQLRGRVGRGSLAGPLSAAHRAASVARGQRSPRGSGAHRGRIRRSRRPTSRSGGRATSPERGRRVSPGCAWLIWCATGDCWPTPGGRRGGSSPSTRSSNSRSTGALRELAGDAAFEGGAVGGPASGSQECIESAVSGVVYTDPITFQERFAR